MSSDAHDIQKEVKTYISVFIGLAILTVVTVAVSYLKVSVTTAIVIALVIASVKASLVACYFMHLISEKKLIYAVLAVTAIFLLAVLLVPLIESYDIIPGIQFVS